MLKPTFSPALVLASVSGLALLLAVAPGCSKNDKSKELRIATASSLAGAFESVGAEFKKESGIQISLVLSSSGNLTQQIKEGAPYDLFASANLKYLDQLQEAGALDAADRTIYAEGRVVMWVKSGEAPRSLSDLKDRRYEHISIANPEHAPYGTAAREALVKAGVWSEIEGRVVRGSNVRQAMQYVESGNAEVGLIALSLVKRGGGSYTIVPDSDHKPLQQAIAVVSSSAKKENARAFIAFLTSEKGAAVLEPYGLEAAK